MLFIVHLMLNTQHLGDEQQVRAIKEAIIERFKYTIIQKRE